MATWRDGPEYAPTTRPTAFVEPPAAPLEEPAAETHASAEAPAEQPAFTPPEQDAPDLASLIPSTVPGRDPQLAFDVVNTTLTTPTAWGAAHSSPAAPAALPGPVAPAWSPQQPLAPGSAPVTGSIAGPPQVQPRRELNPQQFPAPGTPQWFGPPDSGQRFQPPPPQVNLGQVVRSITPAVLIALAAGALLNTLSIVMLALSFWLSSRIIYRTAHIRRLYLAAFGLVGVVGGMALLADDFYFPSALDAASAAAQALCWLLPFALGLVVALALGKGEPPDPRP